MDIDKTNINRLILVGNGFDLAHGMKTTYANFLIDYVISCFSNVGTIEINIPYQDEAFEINTGNSFYSFPYMGYTSITDLIMDLYNNGKLNDLFSKEPFYKGNTHLTNIYNIKFKMPFI